MAHIFHNRQVEEREGDQHHDQMGPMQIHQTGGLPKFKEGSPQGYLLLILTRLGRHLD